MYSYQDRIKYSEVDANLDLTYFGLVNYMQNCSCFHSDDVGVGVYYLAPKRLGWFVTSYEIHIKRLPRYSEKVKVCTWPYQVRGMMAHRLYSIETEDGEVLVYADSLWVLMDLDKLKPSRFTEEIAKAYPEDASLPQFNLDRNKLRLSTALEKVGEFTVTDRYLDTNNHMNNSHYIDVTRYYLPEQSFNTININYKKAALLDDKLDVYIGKIEQGYQVVLKKEDEVYTIVEYK
ncbi:MAG: acyl-[acyl-carrier-protein] thioesterase [Pseudobutyrivibrio ruminis]|uniref:acyl-[acyl-carrier-protein] thioesterase n=1 Tax=Pseudobutyrivibrio ruminis TaxID=46206 RepID=UPI0026F16EF0|nr:acyl-ACP thioesterase domain-containing protein [Pseudobutyrivibrio ruminis]MBE5914585.1 acyl-[acyl-carrier-protein] thioesterase [Pseudobutyrivibrio ruminis]